MELKPVDEIKDYGLHFVVMSWTCGCKAFEINIFNFNPGLGLNECYAAGTPASAPGRAL